jgi:hypothetical protein
VYSSFTVGLDGKSIAVIGCLFVSRYVRTADVQFS